MVLFSSGKQGRIQQQIIHSRRPVVRRSVGHVRAAGAAGRRGGRNTSLQSWHRRRQEEITAHNERRRGWTSAVAAVVTTFFIGYNTLDLHGSEIAASMTIGLQAHALQGIRLKCLWLLLKALKAHAIGGGRGGHHVAHGVYGLL
mgnify:CR=1 FL=1